MTDTERRAWWETIAPGSILPLAFVSIDLAGSTKEWKELPEEVVKRRRHDYRTGVETIARDAGAAQPVNWQGDGVMLFIGESDGGPNCALRAWTVARRLWERVRVDLNLSARIAVHAALIRWQPENGKIDDRAVDLCGHLQKSAPVNFVVVTEDVYLALPPEDKAQLAPIGETKRDRTPAFAFPPNEPSRADGFSPRSDQDLWEAFRNYSRASEISEVKYVGFRLRKAEPPSLKILDVFVPMSVAYREGRRMRLSEEVIQRGAVHRPAPHAGVSQLTLFDEISRPRTFNEAFGEERSIIVIGDPGSGKTTLLRWLAVVAANGSLNLARELGAWERLLPLLVSVGRLAEIRRSIKGNPSVVDALAAYFHERSVGPKAAVRRFLEVRLSAGDCLVLLDGLDEVKREERDGLQTWLESFAAAAAKNRFVVTSRLVGYSTFRMPGAAELVLEPFGEDQIRRYLTAFNRSYRRWEIGVADDASADAATQDILDALVRNPRLRALCHNPFLLSALALIHRAEGRLPQHRVDAYDMISRALCETWDHARRIVELRKRPGPALRYEDEAIPVLGELALRMHERHPTGLASREFIVDQLGSILSKRREIPIEEARESASEFLDRATQEAPVLLERGPDQWGFLHLTFQEFFAVAGLHDTERFESAAIKHLFEPRWEEVIRLGIGYLAHVQKRSKATEDFVRRVLTLHEEKSASWIATVLRKNVALAALLAADAGEALHLSSRTEVAREAAAVLTMQPSPVRRPFLSELAGTDLGSLVTKEIIELLPVLKTKKREWEGIHSLGAIGDRGAIPVLIEYVKSGSEHGLSRLASWALGWMHAVEGIPALLEILTKEKDAGRRHTAAQTLAELNATVAIEPLLAILKTDPDTDMRGAAADALCRLDARQVVPLLLEIAEKDVDALMRGAAARALGYSRSAEVVPSLMRFISTPGDRFVRIGAARALARLRATEAVPTMIEILGSEAEFDLRMSVIDGLGFIGSPEAVPALLKVLRSAQTESMRASTVLSLARLNAVEAVTTLMDLLRNDPSAEMRGNAAHALGMLKAAEAGPLLIQILKKEKDFTPRSQAAWALARLGAEKAVPTFLAILKRGGNDTLRGIAAGALAELKATKAVPLLVKVTNERNSFPADRAMAALWDLAELGVAQPKGKANRRRAKST